MPMLLLKKHLKLGEDEALLADVNSIPADIRQALINNGGGHEPCSLELMTPEKRLLHQAELVATIDEIWFIRRFPNSLLQYTTTRWFWMGLVGCQQREENLK